MSLTHKHGVLFQLVHNIPLLLSVLALSLCTFTFGYDCLVIGNILGMPAFVAQYSHYDTTAGPAFTAQDLSILVAVPITGSFLGAVVATYGADKYGRKKALLVGCLFGVIGGAAQTAAAGIPMFTCGRFVSYISVFILLTDSVAFINEIAPANVRGLLSAMGIVSVNFGGVVSAGISYGTSKSLTSLAYRTPLGMQILFPIIIACGLLYTMDSPTSYLIREDDTNAEKSLRRVREGYSDDEIAAELLSLRAQESLRESEKEVPWTMLFKGPNLRRTLLAGYTGCVQLTAGLFYSTSYATIFLRQVGSADPFLLVFGLSLLALGGAVAGLLIVDYIGRRSLALASFSVLFIIDFVIGLMGCFDLTKPVFGKTLAAFFLLFGFFWAAGFGPLAYITPAEFPTARLKNKTAALAFAVQSATSIICLYVFPYISNPDAGNLGAKIYLMFAGCMLLNLVIAFFIFPELKGRTAAEIDEMFELRLPARKFKGHTCATSPGNMSWGGHMEVKVTTTEKVEEVRDA